MIFNKKLTVCSNFKPKYFARQSKIKSDGRPSANVLRRALHPDVSRTWRDGDKDMVSDSQGLKVDVFVETPKGSRKKYEWDHELKVMRLDRRLFSATVYPADYGYIPGTSSADGEDLDALVLTDEPTFPGCMVTARPVAVIWLTYGEGEREPKIVAVPDGGPTWEKVQDMDDLPEHLVDELRHFFDVYKQLEPSRTPTVESFGGAAEAANALAAAQGGTDEPALSHP